MVAKLKWALLLEAKSSKLNYFSNINLDITHSATLHDFLLHCFSVFAGLGPCLFFLSLLFFPPAFLSPFSILALSFNQSFITQDAIFLLPKIFPILHSLFQVVFSMYNCTSFLFLFPFLWALMQSNPYMPPPIKVISLKHI